MRACKKLQILFALVICSLLAPAMAQAKGMLIFNTGDEMFEVAEHPLITAIAGDGWKLGYKCSHFGLLWADVWTWDCQVAAVNLAAGSYSDLPDEMVAELGEGYSLGDAKRGFWNHYGIFLMLAAFALFVMNGRKSGAKVQPAPTS